MNRLLTFIANGITAFARESAEIWDAMFGGIDRTLTSWASRPAQAARHADHEINDDDEPFSLVNEQLHSEDPILEMQRMGLLDHRSSWDTTDTDMFDHSSSLFDDSSISCDSLDLFDTTCMFDDSSTGNWE